MSYYLSHSDKNIWHGKFSVFPEGTLIHAVSTRLGGVSQPPYDSLNLAFHVEDDADAVRHNRQLFANSLGVDWTKIVSPKQIHGDCVCRVTATHAGRGARDYDSAIADTDALITDEPNLPLLLCFADCVPIMLYDEEHHAIGVAHGGWKGTALNIAAKTLKRMTEEFGTNPADCVAGIAPSIGATSFAVGEDVAAVFRDCCGEDSVIINDGKSYIDLPDINRRQLLAAGVNTVDCAEVDTVGENKWYFSYRGDGGRTGRIAALMCLT